MLLQKNRFGLIQDLPDVIREKQHELGSMGVAKVYTSTSLNKTESANIVSFLEKKTSKQIKLDIEVDESLLAGLKIVYQNTIYDATLENSLNKLKLSFR